MPPPPAVTLGSHRPRSFKQILLAQNASHDSSLGGGGGGTPTPRGGVGGGSRCSASGGGDVGGGGGGGGDGASKLTGDGHSRDSARTGLSGQTGHSGRTGHTGGADSLHTAFSWPFEKMPSNSREEGRPIGVRLSFLPWRRKAGGADKLGTISGVFLPCISQILGVIFFLRLPTITTQAGTIGASCIILLCVLSTFVTSLSLSAIATNGTIQAGGPYYIISRTLGVEVGGSLGLLFYLGTTLGGSMYVMGAVEAFQTNLDYYGAPAEEAAEEALDDLVAYYELNDDGDDDEMFTDPSADLSEGWFGPTEIMCLSLMLALTIVVSVGMKYVNVSAGFFLATVTLSIASILLGTGLFAADIWDGSLADSDRVFWNNLWPHLSPDPKTGITPTFDSLLALFYPSVTGIMAGTNRSAKLAKPSKSIPIGTIGAILVTSSLYLCQVWLLGSVVSHRTMMENKLVVACIAWPSRTVVKIGIITSCIGAALQCLTGAPQLLAAIAVDDAIPFLRFIRPAHLDDDVVTSQSDPKMAIWVTYIIASLATLAGNLDHITPIITMFFLLMYAGINVCTYLLAWVNAPGFRPTFRYFHRNVSLFGFVLCLTMALVISWSVALCAIGLFGINYYYIYKTREREEMRTGEVDRIGTNWGDVKDSLRYKITTSVLMNVTGTENFHAKNWRPQILTVVDTDDVGAPVHMELLALAAQLKKGRGLNMMISIKRGSLMKPGAFEAAQECRNVLRRYMKREGIAGFASVAVTRSDFCEAVVSAVTHSGFGPISPNVVLLPWFREWRDQPDRAEDIVKAIQCLTNMKRAVVLFKGGLTFPRHGDVVENGLIDIYWVVEEGGLCLLLPYLISEHRSWKRTVTIRIFAVATDPVEDLDLLERSVADYCESVRIKAKVNVIDMSKTTIAADMTTWHGDQGDRTVGSGGGGRRMTISKALTMDYEDKFGETDYMNKSVADMFRHQRPAMGQSVGDRTGEEAQMETARMFNNAIRFYSHSTHLVVTNMPLVDSMSGAPAFFAYIDQMCMCVENMMLVRGTEYEVVTNIA